ncbi:MAG: ABC transporter permease [Bacteroides sp.]|nr:ABC transporter permease [Bacteroides sp.]
MNYPLFLARRLSLGSSGRKGSPAVRVATAAVALSVSVMLASIAIVSGFKQEITRKVIGFNSEIQISVAQGGPEENNILTLRAPVAGLLDSLAGISDWSLNVSVPAVFKTSGDFKGIYMRSIADSSTSSFLSDNIEEGRLPEAKEEILISRQAARRLGLETGGKVDTYFFTDDVRVRRFTISGIYNSHFDHYDELLAYAPLETLQKVADLEEWQGSSIRVSVADFSELESEAQLLQHELDGMVASGILSRPYRVSTALTAGSSFFQWLQLLDTNVIVILILMMAVGCVTLVSGMLIIILDKKRFIGLMKALGAPTRSLRKVFIYLAVRIAIWGLAIGNILTLAFLWAQERCHFLPLDPDAYYIDFVPVRLGWEDILILNVGVVIVIYLVLILPSRFVAGISPAETMRDE